MEGRIEPLTETWDRFIKSSLDRLNTWGFIRGRYLNYRAQANGFLPAAVPCHSCQSTCSATRTGATSRTGQKRGNVALYIATQKDLVRPKKPSPVRKCH